MFKANTSEIVFLKAHMSSSKQFQELVPLDSPLSQDNNFRCGQDEISVFFLISVA